MIKLAQRWNKVITLYFMRVHLNSRFIDVVEI